MVKDFEESFEDIRVKVMRRDINQEVDESEYSQERIDFMKQQLAQNKLKDILNRYYELISRSCEKWGTSMTEIKHILHFNDLFNNEQNLFYNRISEEIYDLTQKIRESDERMMNQTILRRSHRAAQSEEDNGPNGRWKKI